MLYSLKYDITLGLTIKKKSALKSGYIFKSRRYIEIMQGGRLTFFYIFPILFTPAITRIIKYAANGQALML